MHSTLSVLILVALILITLISKHHVNFTVKKDVLVLFYYKTSSRLVLG